MATRMQGKVIRRPSLPLTAQDEIDLGLIRTSPSHQRALEQLGADIHDDAASMSESALLHAVFEAGLGAVRAAAAEAGYAELAQQLEADSLERRDISRRRRPRWADEE
ncbi:hypothetical protein [Phycicoccus jejuensis]|uniref:hypothetical protein n=1 Tax=Phycicoccus jejuensis TaxID=367299 RepID=UPI0004C397EC|nr:hypothetical protein [Phycicoccus jejuensis]